MFRYRISTHFDTIMIECVGGRKKHSKENSLKMIPKKHQLSRMKYCRISMSQKKCQANKRISFFFFFLNFFSHWQNNKATNWIIIGGEENWSVSITFDANLFDAWAIFFSLSLLLRTSDNCSFVNTSLWFSSYLWSIEFSFRFHPIRCQLTRQIFLWSVGTYGCRENDRHYEIECQQMHPLKRWKRFFLHFISII